MCAGRAGVVWPQMWTLLSQAALLGNRRYDIAAPLSAVPRTPTPAPGKHLVSKSGFAPALLLSPRYTCTRSDFTSRATGWPTHTPRELGSLRDRGDTLAGHLAGLRAQTCREQTPPHRQGPPGRGQTPETRRQVRGPPASTRNLQMAIVQGTMLYGAELTWNGKKTIEGEYQAAISRMGRTTLGVFPSTPRGIVTAESGLTPARPLLNHRQAGFTRRLYARPQGDRKSVV